MTTVRKGQAPAKLNRDEFHLVFTRDFYDPAYQAVARELANQELRRRSATVAAAATQACPECGAACSVEPDPEPVLLQGLRGELEYTEPRCHCTRCRRDFFPSGEGTAASGA